jgi:AraC-like DNA-binding protein
MPNDEFELITEVLRKKRTFISHKATGPFHIPFRQHPLGRLLFTESGIIHLHVKGKRLMIPSWHCAWIPAGMDHEMWSNSNDLLVRTIFFESSFCKNPCFHQLTIFNGSELFRNMVRHTEKWNENKEEDVYELSFTTVIRQMMPEEIMKPFVISLSSSDEPAFQRILEYVHENFATNISIHDLAKMEHYSIRTLQRLFVQQAGLSFSSYLKTTRILKAIELLSVAEKSISEVAWEVGYNSIPTFSNTFKAITGKRPDHFKRS